MRILKLVLVSLLLVSNIIASSLEYVTKAQALEKLGRYEEALKVYDMIINKDPTYAPVYYYKGSTLWRLQRYKESIDNLDLATELYLGRHNLDSKAHCFSLKASNYNLLGNKDKALENLNLAIKNDPKNDHYYRKKAYFFDGLKEYQKAIDTYDDAIRAMPNVIWFYENKGVVLEKLHKYEEALASYNQGLKKDPENRFFYSRIGKVLRDHLGRKKEAEEALAKAAALQAKDKYYKK